MIVHTGASLTIGLSKELKAKVDLADEKFKGSLKYQWRKNDRDLHGETRDVLTIGKVTHESAGKYTIVVTGPLDEESAPVYVSIWNEEFGSNGGFLSIPVSLFSSSSALTICNSAGFDRWKAYNFYGKACTDQVEPFTNFAYVQLTVNTCCDINPNVDTAIRIADLDGGQPPPQVACADNQDRPCNPAHPNTKVSRLGSPLNLSNTHHYRVVVWFKSSTLGSAESVGFNWMYQNPPP
jgi:hypothetical protein